MITKIQASILYGYGYKLREVKTGLIFSIESMYDKFLYCKGDKYRLIVYYSEIGSKVLIMARPMSELTKEIEGVGVPIVELAKISNPEYSFFSDYQTHSEKNCYVSIDRRFGSQVFEFDGKDFTIENTFDRNDFEGQITMKTPNQLALFQWLYTNHFAVDIPEELITPI